MTLFSDGISFMRIFAEFHDECRHAAFIMDSNCRCNFVSKMHRFRHMTTYWSKIAEKNSSLAIVFLLLARYVPNVA